MLSVAIARDFMLFYGDTFDGLMSPMINEYPLDLYLLISMDLLFLPLVKLESPFIAFVSLPKLCPSFNPFSNATTN
jgi:hypothetical protein